MYPGIIRQDFQILKAEGKRLFSKKQANNFLTALYNKIALDVPNLQAIGFKSETIKYSHQIAKLFTHKINKKSSIEDCAELASSTFNEIATICNDKLKTPVNRKLYPELIFRASQQYELTAKKLKIRLFKKGIKAYKSDLKKLLQEKKGVISQDQLREILIFPNMENNSGNVPNQHKTLDLSWLNLSELLHNSSIVPAFEKTNSFPMT